jgi:hypothetical protein
MTTAQSIILHAELVCVWTALGYCTVMCCAQPYAAIAVWAALQTVTALALLWFVWPGKVVS